MDGLTSALTLALSPRRGDSKGALWAFRKRVRQTQSRVFE